MRSEVSVSAKKPLRDVLAVTLLGVLTLLFYWKILFTGRIIVDYDLFTYFYPYKAYASSALGEGRLPLWNPYLFTGVPLLANIQTAIFYPFNLLAFSLEPPQAVNLSIALHIFLAGTFMYAFARVSVNLDRLSSTVAAMVFMFSGFLSAQIGHINQLNVSIWIPLLFLLFDLTYRRRSLLFALLGGVVVGVQVLAGHPQEFYLTLFGLATFALFCMVREVVFTQANGEASTANPWLLRAKVLLFSAVRAAAFYCAIVVLGLGLASLQLIPTLELSGQSIRAGGLSYKEATSFSLPPSELARALLPGFWDHPFSEFVAYIGILPLFLAGLAFRLRHHKAYAIFCLALIVLALSLALGRFNPLYASFLKFIPGLGLFRVPARWLYLYTFAASVAAGIGMSCFVQPLEHGQTRRASGFGGTIWLAGPLIFFGLLWLFRSRVSLPSFQVVAIWTLFACATMAIIMAGLRHVPNAKLSAGMAILIGGELFFAGRGLQFNKPVPPQAYSSLRPSIAQLLIDKGDFRILSLASSDYNPGDKYDLESILADQVPEERITEFIISTKYKEILAPNIPIAYSIATIDGYDGGVLPLKRYVDFRRLILESGGLTGSSASIQTDEPLRYLLAHIPDTELLGALNIKYIIADKRHDPWVDNIYYDLATTVEISPETPATLGSLPLFEATSLGLITYLEGCEAVSDGTPVALVSITDEGGETITAELKAGVDTAEGKYHGPAANIAHTKARVASPWKDNPQAYNYHAVIDFGRVLYPKEITIEYLLSTGRLYLGGASLIDSRTLASESLVPNQRLRLVHSGDVKVYENLDNLSRAFLVHSFEVATSLGRTLEALKMDVQKKVILTEPPQIDEGPLLAMNVGFASNILNDKLQITRYEAESVKMEAELAAPGFLVLTDSYYPGWRAWVDGSEARIYRADWLFRAVYLPAGWHSIEFRYEPSSFALGWLITRVSLALVIALMVVANVWPKVRQRKAPQT